MANNNIGISKAKPAVVDVNGTLTSISSARENWEATAYKTSNQMLYGVLQQCYELNSKMTLPSEYKLLADYCVARDIRISKGTDTIAKIVKCVFPIDRRRVSTYVTALRIAKQHNVQPAELAAWLDEKGGVTAISLQRADNHKTRNEKASFARGVVFSKNALATVSANALDTQYDAAYEQKNEVGAVVLLARRLGNGEYAIFDIVQSKSVVNAALSSRYANAEKENVEQLCIQVINKRQEMQAAVLANSNFMEAA